MISSIKNLLYKVRSKGDLVNVDNTFDLEVLYSPEIPQQYIDYIESNDIDSYINNYLRQYYYIFKITCNDQYKELLDRFIHHNDLYSISLYDLILFIHNHYKSLMINEFIASLDTYNRISSYTLKDIFNSLVLDKISINNINNKEINSFIYAHNIMDINKINYNYYKKENIVNIPNFFFNVQIRHENISFNDYLFIEPMVNSIICDSYDDLNSLNVQYSINYIVIKDHIDLLENSVFSYLLEFIDFMGTNNIEEYYDDVDEIVEESIIEDKE